MFRRGGSQKLRGRPRNFCDPTSSHHHNSGEGGGGGGGGLTLKFFNKLVISQLCALATHTPILGCVAQGALELCLPQIRKCHFLVTLACLDISSLRKGAYRDFLHIILKHTQ